MHRDGTSLKNWVKQNLKNIGINETEVKIKLLCYPRIFGYVFNPLSVFLFTIKITKSFQFSMKLKIPSVNSIHIFLKHKIQRL